MNHELRYGDPEEVGMSPERVRHVVDLASGWVEQGITPSLVVLAARRGVVVLHESFGRLGPEPAAPPLALDTIFPIASISKPLTATLAMILVEDGLLGLNRPVQEYVPEFIGEGKDKVMVHHLLTHTSGLSDDLLAEYGLGKLRRGELPAPDDWLRGAVEQMPLLYTVYYFPQLYDSPPWKPPGIEMSYCTYGFHLLGEIVERVSGRPLDDFARERLFGPLGMKDTAYVLRDSARPRVVTREGPSVVDAALGTPLVHRGAYGDCSALSTAIDLASFGQMILGGGLGGARIVSRASIGEMTGNQIPGISGHNDGEFFPEASWSYGWNAEGNKKSPRKGSLLSERAVSHGGAGGSYIWIDPAYDLVGVYLSVVSEYDAAGTEKWNADLFANAVTAAVVDV